MLVNVARVCCVGVFSYKAPKESFNVKHGKGEYV